VSLIMRLGEYRTLFLLQRKFQGIGVSCNGAYMLYLDHRHYVDLISWNYQNGDSRFCFNVCFHV